MGSSFSVTNDTLDTWYCVQSHDQEAVNLFMTITEWMAKIGGFEIPGLGSWNSYITKMSNTYLILNGMSPSVVKAIMNAAKNLLPVGRSLTEYIINYTIENAKNQGYKMVEPGKKFFSSQGTLSLRQAVTCICVKQILEYQTNRMYVTTDEIFMGSLYTGGTVNSVNSYLVSSNLNKRKQIGKVEIEPPYGYESWKNLDFNLEQFSENFKTDAPLPCTSSHVVNGQPLQFCLNNLGSYCNPASPFYKNGCDCASRVQTYARYLNTNWINYIGSCSSDAGGLYPSRACTQASNALMANEYYYTDPKTKVKVDFAFVDSVGQGFFQNPACYAAFSCKKDSGSGTPWDTCLKGLFEACDTNSVPCECKRKIMSVRDQLDTNWKYYFNECAHSEIGVNNNCDAAKKNLRTYGSVITNMETNTTKAGVCGIAGGNQAYTSASNFINDAQTVSLADKAKACQF
jgi:hypothetical protein